jgi:hypothetical protein
VPLEGGGKATQKDLFVLARNDTGLVAMMVEGKVVVPLGPTVGEWLVNASPRKRARLSALAAHLGLAVDRLPNELRYQLLHRAASAVIEAGRFHALTTVMIVHSYSADSRWFDDYEAFVRRFAGAGAERVAAGAVLRLATTGGIDLSSAWVCGNFDRLTVSVVSCALIVRMYKRGRSASTVSSFCAWVSSRSCRCA